MVDQVIQEHTAQSFALWEADEYAVTRPESEGLAEHRVICLGNCCTQPSRVGVEKSYELSNRVEVGERRSRRGVDSFGRDDPNTESGKRSDMGGELPDCSGFCVGAPVAFAIGEPLENAAGGGELALGIAEDQGDG